MVTTPKTKIEMVFAAGILPDLAQILKQEAVNAYTVMDVRVGRGKSGLNDGQLDGYTNQYLLLICEQEEEQRLLEALAPLYYKYGGLLISSPIDFHVRTA